MGNDALKTVHDKFADVRNWPLPETRKHIKSFVQFCCTIAHIMENLFIIPLIVQRHLYLCCNNFKSNVIFTEVTKSAFEFLKVQMISALVLLVPKPDHEVTYVAAIDANKIDIVGVLIQHDAARSLKSCIYRTRILGDCEAHYGACDREAFDVVETMSRV